VPRNYRVTLRDVVEAHAQALAFGGLDGVRSWNLIESAIERPYTGYYRSLARKAAALTQSLAQNHGFIDGNKRTALLAVMLLISRSGYRLQAIQDEINNEIEALILDIVENHLTFEGTVEWFKQRLERQ
jgi:death-on-curing protein